MSYWISFDKNISSLTLKILQSLLHCSTLPGAAHSPHVFKASCRCSEATLDIEESQEEAEEPSRSGSKHSECCQAKINKISGGFDQSNTFSNECQDIDIEHLLHGYHLHLAAISNGLGQLGSSICHFKVL